MSGPYSRSLRYVTLNPTSTPLHPNPNFLQADLKEIQQPLLDTLLKLITASEPYPFPGRLVRNLVAECLVLIYTHGETKTLYDSIQVLLKPLDPKATHKDVHKV